MSTSSFPPKEFSHTYFNSQTLIADDVKRLNDGVWLNDNIINFYYLYLENDKFEKDKDSYAFIAPSTSFIVQISETEEDVLFTVGELGLDKKDLVFLPVNDAQDEQAGGSHWALAVYSRKQDTYFYYDSSSNANLANARKLIRKLHPAIKSSAKQPNIVPRKTPQQSNGYDCGMFVLAVTDFLATYAGDDSALSNQLNHLKVNQMRGVVKNLIQSIYEKEK